MEFTGTPMMAFVTGQALPVLLGAAGGFVYYKFIGCKTGACPITSNPWVSTLYGALIGFLIAR